MSDEIVVYVHGMWMPGEEMLFIKRHLEKQHGFDGQLFRYPSVSSSLDEKSLSFLQRGTPLLAEET